MGDLGIAAENWMVGLLSKILEILTFMLQRACFLNSEFSCMPPSCSPSFVQSVDVSILSCLLTPSLVTWDFSLTWCATQLSGKELGNIVMKVFISSPVSSRNILGISDSLKLRYFFLSLDLRDIQSTLMLMLSTRHLWGG